MELSPCEHRSHHMIAAMSALSAFLGLLLFFLLFKMHGLSVLNFRTKPVITSLLIGMEIAPAANNPEQNNTNIKKGGQAAQPGLAQSGQITQRDDIPDLYRGHTSPAAEDLAGTGEAIQTASEGEEPLATAGSENIPGFMNFSLNGRKVILAPELNTKINAEGTVVVDITVDSDGNVTEAYANGRGTTSSSAELKKAAKEAALSTKFTPTKNIAEQKGTISFSFSFQR